MLRFRKSKIPLQGRELTKEYAQLIICGSKNNYHDTGNKNMAGNVFTTFGRVLQNRHKEKVKSMF